MISKFCLILRKGVYHHDYIDSWLRFNEMSLPNQNGFCSNLTMEDITDADCKYAKRTWEDFRIENLGIYHDLKV